MCDTACVGVFACLFCLGVEVVTRRNVMILTGMEIKHDDKLAVKKQKNEVN